MPNFVRHAPTTFEQLGSTISNCSSIEEAARRAFNNKRYDDPVAFLRETNGRTVVAFIRVQDDDGSLSIRKLESFFLGRKTGGKVPLESVPDLFLMSARKIYRYFSTANLVVDSVVAGQKMAERPKKRVVRRSPDSLKKIIDSFNEVVESGRLDGVMEKARAMSTRTTRSSGQLVGY